MCFHTWRKACKSQIMLEFNIELCCICSYYVLLSGFGDLALHRIGRTPVKQYPPDSNDLNRNIRFHLWFNMNANGRFAGTKTYLCTLTNMLTVSIGKMSSESTPWPEKKRPPKHVKITLWIENDSHYLSLYHEKPSICNVFVKFHDN